MSGNGFPKNHPYHSPVAAENLAAVVKGTSHELTTRQTQAMETLAQSFKSLSDFFTQGGLQAALSAHTKGAIIAEIFGGLAAKDGRNALDARTIKQNSLETVELVLSVFEKMSERLQEKNRDPEIKPADE